MVPDHHPAAASTKASKVAVGGSPYVARVQIDLMGRSEQSEQVLAARLQGRMGHRIPF
jgi:hypothetical protein